MHSFLTPWERTCSKKRSMNVDLPAPFVPMSKTKRKRYSADFKAKVALEAIKAEQTINELGSRYGLHPNLITNWKRQAIENLAETFSTKAERTRTNDDPQIKELHAKIGQLTVERDFLAKAFGR